MVLCGFEIELGVVWGGLVWFGAVWGLSMDPFSGVLLFRTYLVSI